MKKSKHMERAKQVRPLTYLHKYVAPKLQKAIRIEAALSPSQEVMVEGELMTAVVAAPLCVCVTCGAVGHYTVMNAGHYLASRRPSIILDERGIHVQCVTCNMTLSGNVSVYHEFMLLTHGQEVIDDLHRLRNTVSKHWTYEELVDLRMEYDGRIKDGEARLCCRESAN